MQNLMKTWHCSKDKCLNTYTLVATSLVTSRSWPWTTSLAPFIFFIIKGTPPSDSVHKDGAPWKIPTRIQAFAGDEAKAIKTHLSNSQPSYRMVLALHLIRVRLDRHRCIST